MRPDRRSVGLRSEELLRKFVERREAGDGDGALHWWGKLVEAEYGRVAGMVDARAARYRFSDDERQEALQRSLVKLWKNMYATYEGSTMGEWVKATHTLVTNVCKDVVDAAVRRSKRETSFDKPSDDENAGSDWMGDEVAWARHVRSEETTEASDFVAWALPQVDDDRRRLVLERTLDGVPAADIAKELGVSMDNLYAIRSRAVKDMRKLHDRWFGS
jgi:DNA-directed RNA polymerase specialized sigma24 family protein